MKHLIIYSILLFTSILCHTTCNAQDSLKITLQDVVTDSQLQTYFEFEDISFNKLIFTGNLLKEKQYIIRLKEYKKGKLTHNHTLFSGEGTEYFRIKTDTLQFKLLSKITKDELTVWIRGNGFSTKRTIVSIDNANNDLAFQSYIDSYKPFITANTKAYLFSFITPKRNKDGSGSWCDVTGSDVNPEELYKEFEIPHYFLVEIEFKE